MAKLTEREKEYRKLKKLFKDLPPNKLKIVDGMLRDIAFLTERIAELEEYLEEHGTTGEYISARGQLQVRERPEHKNYQVCITNRMKLIQAILKEMPAEEVPKENDLGAFMQKGSRLKAAK